MVSSSVPAGAGTEFVVAQFLPAKPNNSGEGLISGSLNALPSASVFNLTLNGANATASVSDLTIQETGSPNGGLSNASSNFILNKIPSAPNAQKIGSTDVFRLIFINFLEQI